MRGAISLAPVLPVGAVQAPTPTRSGRRRRETGASHARPESARGQREAPAASCRGPGPRARTHAGTHTGTHARTRSGRRGPKAPRGRAPGLGRTLAPRGAHTCLPRVRPLHPRFRTRPGPEGGQLLTPGPRPPDARSRKPRRVPCVPCVPCVRRKSPPTSRRPRPARAAGRRGGAEADEPRRGGGSPGHPASQRTGEAPRRVSAARRHLSRDPAARQASGPACEVRAATPPAEARFRRRAPEAEARPRPVTAPCARGSRRVGSSSSRRLPGLPPSGWERRDGRAR